MALESTILIKLKTEIRYTVQAYNNWIKSSVQKFVSRKQKIKKINIVNY